MGMVMMRTVQPARLTSSANARIISTIVLFKVICIKYTLAFLGLTRHAREHYGNRSKGALYPSHIRSTKNMKILQICGTLLCYGSYGDFVHVPPVSLYF